MATSTAVAPSSEKKTCGKPGGAISASRLASRMVVGLELPRLVTWATLSSCSRMAASIFGVAMAVDVAPQAADAVDVLVAVDVGEHAALGPFDDERLVLGHLREGVPDVGAVPIVKFCSCASA